VQKARAPLPQSDSGAVQLAPQTPREQPCPEGQTCPHEPQLMLSRSVGAHPPRHACSPAAQAAAQLPVPSHTVPAGQMFPQEPQLFESLRRLAHTLRVSDMHKT
jgi:hypothetical protein